MMNCRYLTVCVFVSAFLLDSSLGIRITQLKVPPLVRNGTSTAVTLDCEYSMDPLEQAGLVVKWFLNSVPTPVYQWIPPANRPQDLGVLRGRLDLNYGSGSNRSAGLKILNPTTELSGEYKCSVSTFEGEDFMMKRMIVFAPERSLELRHSKPTDDSVNVTCTAEGVFPEPRMALYYSPTPTSTEPSTTDKVSEVRVEGATIETALRGDAYRIRATSELQDRDLTTPTVFLCELRVPDAHYHIRKSIVYYPGSPMPQPETGTSACGSLGFTAVFYLFVCLQMLLFA